MEQQLKEKARRGFAIMNPERQRQIASKGGKIAHELGHAHEWNKEEAKEAARKKTAALQKRLNRTENDGRDDIL